MDRLTQEELKAKGQHGTCETMQVTIEGHKEPITINASDFDEKVHTKVEKAAKPKKAAS